MCIRDRFLNCGMRLSELVGINLSDMKEETLTITGKGNKERVVYLNDACRAAIKTYLAVRPVDGVKDKDALFLSSRKSRISGRRVEQIVEKALQSAGLSAKGYSPHKLRHTAATLMYQHGGVDIRALKEVLGHENIATTETVSYTHLDVYKRQVYGPRKVISSLEGQCLHAKTIAFLHPKTGELLSFDSPLPGYFTRFLSTLKRR